MSAGQCRREERQPSRALRPRGWRAWILCALAATMPALSAALARADVPGAAPATEEPPVLGEFRRRVEVIRGQR